MGFHYIAQLSVIIKKYHSVYKQQRNEFPFAREMHSCVFNEFWLVFCLFCTVYLEGLVVYCENWVLFVISHQKTFWGFLVHSNFVLRSPENSKGFLIRDAKQSLLRNETQFSQCTTKPSRFTVQNKRKPLKTHCAQSCAFLSLMQTRSFFIFSRKSIIS